MLRTEILQYLEEYQSVRNMMYTATAALLAFGIDTGQVYMLLLPLVVIIPSYSIAMNYWGCVVKAATYLQCFYEENTISHSGYPIQWETRAHRFKLEQEKQESEALNNGDDSVEDATKSEQLLPYKVAALVCHAVYYTMFFTVNIPVFRGYLAGEMSVSLLDCFNYSFQFWLGIITFAFTLYFMRIKKPPKYSMYKYYWEQVRTAEFG